jgi:hypothetical protein
MPHPAVRPITRKTCCAYPLIIPFLKDRDGLEIGGPSPLFAAGGLSVTFPVVGSAAILAKGPA